MIKNEALVCALRSSSSQLLWLTGLIPHPYPEASLRLSSVSLPQIMEEPAPSSGRSAFVWLVGASQVVGLASVVLTGVWMGHYRGGFAWDGTAQEFNLHPLCMVLGLVFLQGDGEWKRKKMHYLGITSKSVLWFNLYMWCNEKRLYICLIFEDAPKSSNAKATFA